jgi:hypothetical protein
MILSFPDPGLRNPVEGSVETMKATWTFNLVDGLRFQSQAPGEVAVPVAASERTAQISEYLSLYSDMCGHILS